MPVTAPELLDLSQLELDEVFRGGDAAPIPLGEGKGTVILTPETRVADIAARLSRLVVWKGKVFDPVRGELLSETDPVGNPGVGARVYVEKSWFDNLPAIVLDYSRTSVVAHWIRDEIRMVAPGLYLGIVFWDDIRALNFSLAFD